MSAKVISKDVFVHSPGPGQGFMGGNFYTQSDDLRLMSVHVITQRSDTVEVAYIRYSDDNGRTWSDATE